MKNPKLTAFRDSLRAMAETFGRDALEQACRETLAEFPTTQPSAAGEAAHTPMLALLCARSDADAYRDIVALPDHYVIAARVDKEVAAFIVRACNSHAGLVAAHDKVARVLGVVSTNIMVLGGQLSEGEHKKFGEWLLLLQSEVTISLEAARAELAKAKGGAL
jgi:hypothetical protein